MLICLRAAVLRLVGILAQPKVSPGSLPGVGGMGGALLNNHGNLFFLDPEIIDVGVLDGPWAPETPPKGGAAFWSGFWGPRSRTETQKSMNSGPRKNRLS